MSLEIPPDQIDIKESRISLPFPTAVWGRILFGLFVIVMPIVSFSLVELLTPEWQNGELRSYVTLLLMPQASLIFLFLLAYSVISYLLLLFAPDRFASAFYIRLGIYTGVFLALQYSLALLLYSLDATVFVIAVIWALPLVIPHIYRSALKKWEARTIYITLIVIFVVILSVMAGIGREILTFPFLVLVMAAPFWSFLIAIRMGIWLFRNHETTLTNLQGLGLAVWLATYFVALRFDILKMYELYAALPPQPPPDCYIASAAAYGHPQFVRARTVRHADGETLQINTQLQILKCAELALQATNPLWHRWLRNIYDTLGKSLARKIQNPFIADLAYLLLKPCEWLARLILKAIIPNIDLITKEIYIRQ